MRKISLLILFAGVALFSSGCLNTPAGPYGSDIRYLVTAEPIDSHAPYLTEVHKIMFMENANLLPTTIDQPGLPWEKATSMPKDFLAQLTVLYLSPENAVSQNTRIKLTIYKDGALYREQTFSGKEITDSASMIIEGAVE